MSEYHKLLKAKLQGAIKAQQPKHAPDAYSNALAGIKAKLELNRLAAKIDQDSLSYKRPRQSVSHRALMALRTGERIKYDRTRTLGYLTHLAKQNSSKGKVDVDPDSPTFGERLDRDHSTVGEWVSGKVEQVVTAVPQERVDTFSADRQATILKTSTAVREARVTAGDPHDWAWWLRAKPKLPDTRPMDLADALDMLYACLAQQPRAPWIVTRVIARLHSQALALENYQGMSTGTPKRERVQITGQV